MKRAILLLNHGLGDVLMALPLLRRCARSLRPGNRLLILVKSATERVVVRNACAGIRGIRILCIGHMLSTSRFATLKLALWLRRQRPTLFLLPHASERIQMTLLAGLVGADVTVVPRSRFNGLLFRDTVPKTTQHKVPYYVRFADVAGVPDSADVDTRLKISDASRQRANTLLPGWRASQTWIGLSPGSGPAEAHKRWPVAYYRSLAERLLERDSNVRVAVFGSPAERELVAELTADLESSRIIAISQDDVMVTAAAYSLCACIVSGCSGSVHLAAAVGAPVVGLYGPTNPGFTGPHAAKCRIVRAGLRCSPCYRLGFGRGCGNPVCMSLLDVDRVEREVLLALAGRFTSEIPWCETTRARKPDLRLREPGDKPASDLEPEEIQV